MCNLKKKSNETNTHILEVSCAAPIILHLPSICTIIYIISIREIVQMMVQIYGKSSIFGVAYDYSE